MFAKVETRTQLFRNGRQRVVRGEVHVFPFSVHDFLANLRGGFALLRFTVREGRLFFAQDAVGAV